MRLEIESAANFLSNLLRLHADVLTPAQLQVFRATMETLLATHYQQHWFPEKPFKGSGYRCLRINHKMDPMIAKAGLACGINEQALRQLFPNELTMWIDPKEVSYRIGENGSICVLYDAEAETTAAPGNINNNQNNSNTTAATATTVVNSRDLMTPPPSSASSASSSMSTSPSSLSSSSPSSSPERWSYLSEQQHHHLQHHNYHNHHQQQQQQQQQHQHQRVFGHHPHGGHHHSTGGVIVNGSGAGGNSGNYTRGCGMNQNGQGPMIMMPPRSTWDSFIMDPRNAGGHGHGVPIEIAAYVSS